MSYFEFPHTRNYDGDLGYIIKKLDELTKRYNNFFDYNSIRFHDPLEWNITETYTANNIVFDTQSETLYISKTAVPAGIDISNTDYWILVTPFKVDIAFSTSSINPIANKSVTNKFISIGGDINTLNERLALEIANRTTAETAINGAISSLSSNITEETGARVEADALINARIDDIIALEPGSTTGDAELQDIRIDVNGYTYATAGNAVRGQIKDVKGLISEISDITPNLFDPELIKIGRSAINASGFPKRAIAGIIKNSENGLFIKAYNLPANLKFDVEYYSSDSYNSRVSSSSWINDDSTYHCSTTQPYIAILFGSVDNNNLTPANFEGLKLMINDGNGIYTYIPHLTAKDIKARNITGALYSEVQPFGIIPAAKTWTNSTVNNEGVQSYSSYRLLSDFVEIPTSALLNFEFSNDDTSVSIIRYDANKNFVNSSGYISSASANHTLPTNNNKYIKFLIRYNDDTAIDPKDIMSVGIKCTITEDTFNRNELTVATYNVGRWNYGTPAGIPSADFDKKVIDLRRCIGELDCDILAMQEFDRLIEQGATTQANDAVFNHFYSFYQDTGSWESIKSKFRFATAEQNTLIVSPSRYYVHGYMNIGDKVVYVLNVHLTPGYDAASEAVRALEVNEILSMLSDKDYFILFGDFNPNPDEASTLYANFSNAGYNVANCSFFGDYWTWTTNRDDFNHYDNPTGTVFCPDNIITSSNITILDTKTVNIYNKSVSDHIPLIAKLAIN